MLQLTVWYNYNNNIVVYMFIKSNHDQPYQCRLDIYVYKMSMMASYSVFGGQYKCNNYYNYIADKQNEHTGQLKLAITMFC